MEHPEKRGNKPQRKRKLSKRALWLIALGGALAIAATFVLLLPAIRERFPSQLAESMKAKLTFKTLDTGDVNVLDSITVTHDDGETYTLLYRDENLYLQRTDGETEIVNEGYTDEIIQAATDVAVEDTVTEDVSEVQDNLADMGLNPPKITVKVVYSNDREVELQLGGEVPDTTYHYYRWSGDNGVYMCDSGIYEAFEYTAHMLLPVEQPTLVPALIDRLTLDTQAAGKIVCSFVADGTDAYLGTLHEPYTYPMDSDATTTLLNAFKNFRLGTKLEPVTADNRAKYGFDHPTAVVDVHQQKGLYTQIDSQGVLQTLQTEDQTVRLKFGAKDGEYFYFCEYAGECYRVSSFLVSAFIEADPEKYLSNAPANMGSANIASIAVQLGNGALDVRATYTEHVLENNQIETDTDGNTVYDISVTANGEAITTDAFDSLVTRLKQMTVSGRLNATDAPTGTPRWQMTLTTTGGTTRTLAAYPMDAFSDVLVVDGVSMHYINAEAIQLALAEMYPTARLTTPKAG
ncbi:MAG TPA: DUF4340 domain-containing protein [Candidatus Limiplasma sp.]|nr:DUF4340 domain-containing protein [Candidatus Limiplasma sp.]